MKRVAWKGSDANHKITIGGIAMREIIENIKSLFRYLFSKPKGLYLNFADAVRRRSVSDCLHLGPNIARIASYLFALIQLIRFIVGNGFKIQIDLIKEMGLGAINEIFTSGTAADYFNVIFCVVMGVLLIPAAVISLIEFFRKEKIWRKVLAIISAVLCVASFGLSFISYLCENEYIDLQISLKIPDYVISILIFASFAFIIGAIALLVTAPNTGKRIFNAFGSALIVFGIVPLAILLIENILGLALTAVFVIILLVVFSYFGAGVGGLFQDDEEKARYRR